MVSRLRHIAELKQKGRHVLLPLWFGFFGITGSLTQVIIIDIEYQRIDVDSADGWLKFKKDFGIEWMYEKSKINCAMNHLPQLIRVQDYNT